MKTSKAFRLTKAHLWDGKGDRPLNKSTYICYAAEKIVSPFGDKKASDKVKRIIERLLGKNNVILEEWLYRQNPKYRSPIASYGDPAYIKWRRKVQQTRHAWLDHLIAHYESKGD